MGRLLYGAAVVVFPGALLAYGIRRGTANPAAAAAGFMFWELVKIAVASLRAGGSSHVGAGPGAGQRCWSRWSCA